ncbi:GGDEF domain-containing protein [Oceanimonas pelagia]|uniref:diguanylate cyclase n=1 Tax=Oceanimonas pelagia TaxID=3028314 RepID=A0AA50KPI5_9GAMM|nr:diguanylate cyclase [Oceanimonas pelagia]WMC10848.1 GGDEF domain-containing protein [Oceanimonas pelagia]
MLTEQATTSLAEAHLWHALPQGNTITRFSQLRAALNHAETVATTLGGEGTFGLRLNITARADQSGTWFVRLPANYLDRGLAYWQPRDGRLRPLPGFGQGASRSARLLHQQALPLTLAPGEAGVLWLLIEAKKFPTPVQPHFVPEAEFYRQQFATNSTTLLGIAVMLTLGLIALFAYIRTKAPVTLACAGYVGLHGIGWFAASGAWGFLLGVGDSNPAYWGMMLFPFAIACASQFTRLLFDCRSLHPRLNRFFNVLSVLCLGLGLLMPWLPFVLGYQISHAIALLWVPTAIATGAGMLGKKDFRAKYYLAGNLLYGAALLVYMLLHIGRLDLAGSAEVMVVLALALDCFCILLSLAEWLQMQQQEYRRSYQLSRLDILTGIGNRHAFHEHIDQLGNRPYCLVFIDVDGFKAINDTHGHDEGDRFLVFVARQMQMQLDKLGSVYRTGGDEFLWLVPITQPDRFMALQQQLQQRLHASETALRQAGWHSTGLSHGMATSLESNGLSQCLALADERMYQHKHGKVKAATGRFA